MGIDVMGSELKEKYGEQLGLAINSVGNGSGGASRPACPECGTATVFQEGCEMCQACAWNKCGG